MNESRESNPCPSCQTPVEYSGEIRVACPGALELKKVVPIFHPGAGYQMKTITITLVGCGKTKLDHLFKMSRRYAGQLGHTWAILSAKHGLVTPDEFLDPYDQQLSGRLDDIRVMGNRISWPRGIQKPLWRSGAIDIEKWAGQPPQPARPEAFGKKPATS